MADQFMGEIRIFSFAFAPREWSVCNGQTMPINQNQALFSLLGTMYGGNGQTTFGLPNLQSRIPVHFGQGPGLADRYPGETGGTESHTLNISELPAHSHTLGVVNRPGTQTSPTGGYLAAHRGGYAESGNTTLGAGTVSNIGGSQPHANMPPYLVLNFCIAITGQFPF